MANVAREVIWPDNSDIILRVVFLYVGQGDCTIVLTKDGDTYKTFLIDINRDEKNGGIDVPKLMVDLLEENNGELDVFVNTHPHDDHLRDIVPLSEAVDIQEIWHSGHKPGKKHEDSFKNLQKVINKVKKEHGEDAETELEGSRAAKDIGEAQYHVLAPAKHVKDDIDEETSDERYRRIHEQCTVLKFGYSDTWVMLTGDADRDAWEKHITVYHKDRLPAQVLSAAHHGSRTFFRYDKDDNPYLDALQTISPDYVILSAPTSKESPHDHPHQDAVELYEEEVDKDNILHTGKNRECFICDIYSDGGYAISDDTKLVDEYEISSDNANRDEENKATKSTPAIITGTKIDRRPMG